MVTGFAGRPPVVLAAAVIAGAMIVGGAMLLAPMLGALLVGWSAAWQETLFATLLYGLLALFAIGGRRLAGISGGVGGRRGWTAIGLGIGVGGLMLALADAGLAGGVRGGAGEAPIATLVLGTLVVIGQSASEELYFRGWIQPALMRNWSPPAAIAVTALAFAALHVAGGARSPVTLVNLMLGGVLFGLLAWRGGGLLPATAAHAGWNWAEAILFGLDPNPGTGSYGALHDLDLVGAAWWGGSAEGLNASIAMTIVLAALILPLARPLAAGGGISRRVVRG